MKEIVKEAVISLVLVMLMTLVFAGAVLQDSYRKYPPTAQERAEHPFIVEFLAGGE